VLHLAQKIIIMMVSIVNLVHLNAMDVMVRKIQIVSIVMLISNTMVGNVLGNAQKLDTLR
jgi:hypothetical protein